VHAFIDNMNSEQCSNAAAAYSFNCYFNDVFYLMSSNDSMTIEKCFEICVKSNGFKYAGLLG
jgi:hypothetical protein